MATKTISITEEAYKKLASLRERENESFSEVINKVTNSARIENFFGILSKESADRLEERIKKVRKEREKADKKRTKKIKSMFK